MRSLRLPSLLLLLAGAAACAAEGPATPVLPPPEPVPTLRAPSFGVPPPEASVERRLAEIRIAPAATGGEVDRLEVAIQLSEPPGDLAEPGILALSLAQAEGGEQGWADAVEELYARDAEGALPLRRKPSAGEVTEWRSERRAVGPIRVGYRVRLARSDGGHFHGIRAHARGFEGSGATFLLLPETADTYRIRLTWDLGAAGEGASAFSSLGSEASAPLARIREAVFMAGPLGRLSAEDAGARFEGAWLGRAGFDPLEALPWLSRVRAVARAFFHDDDGAPFTVVVRVVPGRGPGWGVTSVPGGLRLLAGEEMGFGREARFHLAHEVVQRWIGGEAGVRFEGPDPAPSWFAEGFGAHFARELLLRSGLASVDEVADDLRERFPSAPMPQERPDLRLPRGLGIADDTRPRVAEVVVRRARSLPGMLYAADLDAAMRAKSGGRRSLDELVLALLARARAGKKPGEPSTPLPAGAFRELVDAELGAEGLARFDAAIGRGEPVTPPSEAFGPCFKREKRVDRGGKGGTFVWHRDPRAAATCARRAGK